MNKKLTDEELFKRTSAPADSMEVTQGDQATFWVDAMRRFRKNKGALAGMVVFSIVIVAIIFSPFASSYYQISDEVYRQATIAVEENDIQKLKELPINLDFESDDLTASLDQQMDKMEKRIANGSFDKLEYSLLPPKVPVLENFGIFDGTKDGVDVYAKKEVPESMYFYFGTDSIGRDNFVRVFEGAKLSIFIGLIAATIDILVGLTIGGISGYYGGKFDLYIQRFVDTIASIPTIILLIILSMYFSNAGKTAFQSAIPIILAITITGWIGMNRIVRAQVLKIKEYEFVLASKTLGGNGMHIIGKHIIPNTMPTIIIVLMFTIPSAIFFEAFLSFLGLGIPAPYASLGTLVNDGRNYITTQPFLLIFPSIVLSCIMLSFNMMADGFRDALDPKMRGGK